MSPGLDETTAFQPRFDQQGLIPAIVTDARDDTLLMVAHMNADALRLTIETGKAHFWSRSRQALWKKGETSGDILEVREILTDCDQDAIQLKAVPLGRGEAVCHTGRQSCFYRRLKGSKLEFTSVSTI